MFQIDNTLVSEEIVTSDFVCNLSACKGSCCVEGEAGAPLEQDETEYLEKNYNAIAPFLSEKGRASIEKQGKFISLGKMSETRGKEATGYFLNHDNDINFFKSPNRIISWGLFRRSFL